MLAILKDFFFPKQCCVCGKLEELLCNICERELSFAEQICPMCEEYSVMGWTHKSCRRELGLDGLISIFEYADPAVRSVVDSIKYDFNEELVKRIFLKIVLETGMEFDLVVPVPLHFYRYNWRGFNQAELVGQSIAEKLKIDCVNILRRTKNTKQQVSMKSRKDREKNVKGVFKLRTQNGESLDLKGKKILLVDDVFTTGASMKECCKVLKMNGAEEVWGITLAH